jgi:hypothetical protein
MPTGACSRGYKLRSREGVGPKPLSVEESLKSSIECFYEEFRTWCVIM